MACARSSEQRDEASIGPTIPRIQQTGGVAAALRDLSWHYQVIAVDAGGRDPREMRLAVAVSNLLLVLTRASQAGPETLPKVNELVSLARGLGPNLKAFTVLSMAPSNSTIRGMDDACEALNQFDQLEPADTVIRDRKVYRDTLLNGNGMVELSNSQAYAEVQLLAQEFFEVAA